MNKVATIQNNTFDTRVTTAMLEIPSLCPHCSTSYGDIPISTTLYHPEKNAQGIHKLSATYHCPFCGNCFVVDYIIHSGGDRYHGLIMNTFPESSETTIFSEQLNGLSPDFVELYNQAESAESAGLNKICGMGYRKALEFLVKDYACFLKPDAVDKIPKASLAQCIRDYISDDRIKTLAIASAWIGNDETHYLRKHEDYNCDDLKAFILTLVHSIEYDFQYLRAKALLESK